jgi:glycine dehydrogenase subunit 1
MRYLPHSPEDRTTMLERIGVRSVDDLFTGIPAGKRMSAPPALPARRGELDVERALRKMAERNVAAGAVPFFLGCGAYKHHVPATVDHLIQRSEFLTSYTPYQPEIAQGTLQYLFEFQTQVAMLTGMEVANASMYDGSTAAAEAVLMAHRVTKRRKALLSGNLHPHYRDTIATICRFVEEEMVSPPPSPQASPDLLDLIDDQTSCVVVQYPDYFGHIGDLAPIAARAHSVGALLVAVVTEAVSFGLLKPPGAMDADIVVAEGQSIGNALSFGGPYVGLFASRQKYVRQMPGRLSGETVDVQGRRGFVLTLSAREQHIRRERATSNICTNSGLCALAFSIHMTLLGEAGLRRLARINHANAIKLADRLAAVPGVSVLNSSFFNEFTIRVPGEASQVVERLAERGILGGVPASRLDPGRPDLAGLIIVAATEVNTPGDIDAYAQTLTEILR